MSAFHLHIMKIHRSCINLNLFVYVNQGIQTMKILDKIAMILLVISGLNWGAVGVADYNIFMWIFIRMHMVQHMIYIAFGLAAIWVIARFWMCKSCRR